MSTPRAIGIEVMPARRRMTRNAAPILEGEEYPRTWSQYIGQEPAKRMLQVAARSARLRKAPMEHVLIAHPSPGIGKTALAVLVANEMKRPCRVAPSNLSANTARLILSEMNDRDLLFIDEFHKVMDRGRKHAEWMLHLLQDNVIMGPMGPEEQPHVTIIAATTDAARLPESITGRFLEPPMQEYTDDEATKITLLAAKDILAGLPKLTKHEAGSIAAASHNNPRAMRRLLTTLRDMTITESLPLVRNHYDIPGLLAWQGVTPDGLDLTAQRYLQVLATEFDGSAGAKALEDRLQQPGGLASTERVLMDKGLIAKTRTGRTLTGAGIARYQELVAGAA